MQHNPVVLKFVIVLFVAGLATHAWSSGTAPSFEEKERLLKIYGQCSSDDECVAISDCGDIVNKKYAEKAKKEGVYHEECFVGVKDPIPLCKNNQCTYKLKN